MSTAAGEVDRARPSLRTVPLQAMPRRARSDAPYQRNEFVYPPGSIARSITDAHG